jgi:hypothetical protein
MASILTFFNVGNGDMTLLSLGDASESKILIDCNIRAAADDPNDGTRDVASDLRGRLKSDAKRRPFVDAFLLTHPDQDHCRGIQKHFFLGDLTSYPDDGKPDSEKRIVIREIWSSPMVFRRASKSHSICDDARAFNCEAKRRVRVNRDRHFFNVPEGDRILILGEDENGKTFDLQPILVKTNQAFSKVNGTDGYCFSATLLAPMPKSDDATEEMLSKNQSSVILNIEIGPRPLSLTTRNFLTGGDADVAIWERLWEKHRTALVELQYDILQTPHHCSWHSLSYESWSDTKGKATVCEPARSAMSQMRRGGYIIAGSAPIKDDYCDPPCYGAKAEYEKIATRNGGRFYCTGEYPPNTAILPLELRLDDDGLALWVRDAVLTTARPLLRPAAAASGLNFPPRPVVPNKPAGFA